MTPATGEIIGYGCFLSDLGIRLVAGLTAASDEALLTGDPRSRQKGVLQPKTERREKDSTRIDKDSTRIDEDSTGVDKDSTSIPVAPWIREILPSVREIESLPPNWDSYGSRPPSHKLLTRVLQLLQWTEMDNVAAPAVVPVSGGGVQLEWYLGTRELEVEFKDDGAGGFLATDVLNRNAFEGEFYPCDYNTMRVLLAWLSEA